MQLPFHIISAIHSTSAALTDRQVHRASCGFYLDPNRLMRVVQGDSALYVNKSRSKFR